MTTFVAMLWRDAHVARRNFIQLAFQTLMQPMMFVFVFGRVMTTSGFMPPGYKSLLLPIIWTDKEVCRAGFTNRSSSQRQTLEEGCAAATSKAVAPAWRAAIQR